MKSHLLTASIATALAAGSLAGTEATAETAILFNQFAPPQHILNRGIINPWIAAVEKATHGRVKVKVPGNSLAPPPRQMDIVKDGIADGAYIFNAFLVKKAPLIQVSLLPGVARSATGSAVALWRTYEAHFAKANEFSDVVLLGFMAAPAGEIYSLGSPIRKIEEFKNIKMWSLPALASRAMGALGCSVVPGPATQMYQIISKGTVDAFAGVSISSAEQFKVLQYAKSVTVVPEKIQGPTFSVFVSKAKWAEISPDDRKAILKVSGEALARRSIAADELEKNKRQEYRRSGKPYIEASPEFVEAVQAVWKPFRDEWVAQANKRGVDGAAALSLFREVSRQITEELPR